MINSVNTGIRCTRIDSRVKLITVISTAVGNDAWFCPVGNIITITAAYKATIFIKVFGMWRVTIMVLRYPLISRFGVDTIGAITVLVSAVIDRICSIRIDRGVRIIAIIVAQIINGIAC